MPTLHLSIRRQWKSWRTTLLIWIGILLVFGVGYLHPREIDFYLLVFQCAFVLAGSIYTIAIWVRGQAKRNDADIKGRH